MSATTEKLLEEIKHTEISIEEAKASGNVAASDSLTVTLKTLRKKLSNASEALMEGKTLLKG